MKTSLLPAAIALTLGSISQASAGPINIDTMWFPGAFAAAGTINFDASSASGSMTGEFQNSTWTATALTGFEGAGNYNWSGSGGTFIPGYGTLQDQNDDDVAILPFNYDFTLVSGESAVALSFDWGTTYDIPVLAIFDCDSSTAAGAPCTGQALPMATPPFAGTEPAWSGYLVYDSTAAFSSDATPISVNENVTGTVYTAAASAGTADIPTYSLSGTDAGLFTISNASGTEGQLSFDSAPDHENADDAGADNVYDVTVTATFSDATGPNAEVISAPLPVDLAISITVLDVNEFSPVFSSVSSVSVDENKSITGYTAAATDADTSNAITYSIASTGADDALFNVNSTTGELTFKSAPDFEANGSSAGNNTYVVDILATDSGSVTNSTTQTVTVNVTDVAIETLQITSLESVSVFENVTTAYTLTASGPNSITLNQPTGTDASLFTFDASSGILSFKNPPDFDAGQTTYNVIFTATDIDGTTPDFPVTITVQDVNDQAPSFDSLNTASLYENETLTGYTALTTDTDTIGTVVYSLAGTGADDALFEIDANTGVLSFITAPDYEANGSAANNNTYVVDVRAFDGTYASVQTVTVTVLDAVANPPTITAPSQCPIALTEGGTYSRPAATATDDLDGNISSSIVVDDSSVDTSVPGDYVVTYNVSNSEGDAAPEVTCNVSVNGRPKVFINGASIINLNVNDAYTDAGARATDVEDGVLNVTVSGTVNTSVAGVYDITYSATDSNATASGTATGSATRRVIVKAEAGVVRGIDSLTISSGEFALGDGAFDPIFTGGISEFVMGSYQGSAPGVYGTTCDSASGNSTPDCTAQDYSPTSLGIFNFADFGPVGIYTASTDGTDQNVGLALPSGTVDTVNSTITLNIPSWIAFWNGNSFAQGPTTADGTRIEAEGTYNPATNTYDISWDALVVGGAFNGQMGHWNIGGIANLVAFDSVYPEITLNGSTQVAITQGDTYTDAGVVSATDNVDGDLGVENVTVSGGVDTNTIGTYTITYSIADSSGNVAVETREVVVVNGSGNQPVISLNGDAVIDLALNDTFTDPGFTASDSEDGDLTASVIVSGDTVDTSELGAYIITYDVIDSSGTPAFRATRTVNVVDVVVPVIALEGSASVYIQLGSEYIDAGATATDNVDTNPGITNRIIDTADTVDTSVEGAYVITYDVTDSAGNVADTVTRTVYVDSTGPEITITGQPALALNIGDIFSDEGATATDAVSGDLNVTIGDDCSAVDTTVAGNYTCTYTSVDDAGNETVVVRSIVVLSDVIASAPVLTLTVQQSVTTGMIVTDGGPVTVSTNIISSGSDTFDWSATNNSLLAAVTGTLDSETLVFDPVSLSEGVYEIVVTTNAGTELAVTSRRLVQVVLTAPVLDATDSDGDGIADSLEGITDDDNDGIPNYLDNNSQTANQIGAANGAVITASTGTMRLGYISFAASTGSSVVSIANISENGGVAGGLAPANTNDSGAKNSCVGGCFDFEVADVDPGTSVDVVLPLTEGVPANGMYRKYTRIDGWKTFDTSGSDAIASSGKVNGECPAPDANNRWIDGLFEGDMCIRLTIQDGGPNDTDGLANGVIVDPSGTADMSATPEANRDFAEGCSMSKQSIDPMQRSEWLILVLFITMLGLRQKFAKKH